MHRIPNLTVYHRFEGTVALLSEAEASKQTPEHFQNVLGPSRSLFAANTADIVFQLVFPTFARKMCPQPGKGTFDKQTPEWRLLCFRVKGLFGEQNLFTRPARVFGEFRSWKRSSLQFPCVNRILS